jgi:hypothetical protein
MEDMKDTERVHGKMGDDIKESGAMEWPMDEALKRIPMGMFVTKANGLMTNQCANPTSLDMFPKKNSAVDNEN